jgi:replicative superfamily II helicase
MVRVDERVARCLALLRSPEMQPFLQFLKDRRQETLERLGDVQGEEMKSRLQGRNLELKELLEMVEQAEMLYAKTRR